MAIFTASNTINKNLINFAKAQGLELYFDAVESRITLSEFDEDGEAFCEWLFSYNVVNGELFFGGNIYFSEKEELPHWIATPAKLKELITFTATTLKAEAV